MFNYIYILKKPFQHKHIFFLLHRININVWKFKNKFMRTSIDMKIRSSIIGLQGSFNHHGQEGEQRWQKAVSRFEFWTEPVIFCSLALHHRHPSLLITYVQLLNIQAVLYTALSVNIFFSQQFFSFVIILDGNNKYFKHYF